MPPAMAVGPGAAELSTDPGPASTAAKSDRSDDREAASGWYRTVAIMRIGQQQTRDRRSTDGAYCDAARHRRRDCRSARLPVGGRAQQGGSMKRASLLLAASALAVAVPAAGQDPGARVAALTKGFEGQVFLYAKNLDTGAEFARGADERVRTASTIKVPILCALASEIAAGRVSWEERIPLAASDKISGSGVMRELSEGTALSVRELANLMIVVSDNTATNLLLDRITTDTVNDYLDTIGIRQTRSLRKVRSGNSPPKAGSEGWSRAGRLEENQRFGLGVATPREMVRLLEMLEQGKVVSAGASKDILATLRRQQFKDGIGRRAEGFEVASKSGSLDALRSDVGIAYTKAGRIAIAITVDGMPKTDYSPDNAGNILIWEITKVLIEELAHEKGKVARGHLTGTAPVRAVPQPDVLRARRARR
jgi:beta-lactamase class A